MELLETCDVTSDGGHLGSHLGFYQGLKNKFKPQEFFCLCLTYKIAHKYALCIILSTFSTFIVEKVEKTCIFTQIWVDRLVIMTSYLVTITKRVSNCVQGISRQLMEISGSDVLSPRKKNSEKTQRGCGSYPSPLVRAKVNLA